MSDKVKQAAERLRDGMYSSLDDLDEYYMSSRKFEDMEILANAYLDEHDPETAKENATLLTAEILQASGWNNSFGSWGNSRAGFRLSHNNAHPPYLWSVSGEVDDIGGYLETVGDLRKLLEALHVPAVVVVPKGGE